MATRYERASKQDPVGPIDPKYTKQMTSPARYFAYWATGFVCAAIGGLAIGMLGLGQLWAVLLGIVGILLAWTLTSIYTKYQEQRADSVTMGVIGIASFYICEFILVNLGVNLPSFSEFNADWFGWHVFILVVAILFVIFNLLWVYGEYLKQTPEEKDMVLHGDDWFEPGEPQLRLDCGITLDCTADEIWPYMVQSGQSQAGWYSFDWLEKIFTFDITNHYTIHPEWQDLKPGDYQWFHQAPFSIGEWVTEHNPEEHYWAAHSDSRKDPNGPNDEKALLMPGFKSFAWTWNWYVYDIGGGRCRYIQRCDCAFTPKTTLRKWFIAFLLGTASIVMCHGYMSCMQRIARGTQKVTDKHI